MRNAFIETLEKEVKANPNIIVLTGDLGYTVFDQFKIRYPKQFINMGVAEANMMGVAAGLALSGKIPFVYSIAPFVCLRPYEQIRNDVCMHNANVKIIGVGGGLAYSNAGPTHHVNEDIAVMRVLPNMTVICPSDPIEVRLAVKGMIRYKGPVYLRLGKHGEPIIHKTKPNFKIGKGIIIKEGRDIALISCGSITHNALLTAEILEKKGIFTTIVSMHTIKPLDTKLLSNVIKKFKAVFTIEEHNIIGGLGSAVAEFIAENQTKTIIFKRLGVNDVFCRQIGDYDYIRDCNSLSPKKIVNQIIKTLNIHG